MAPKAKAKAKAPPPPTLYGEFERVEFVEREAFFMRHLQLGKAREEAEKAWDEAEKVQLPCGKIAAELRRYFVSSSP